MIKTGEDNLKHLHYPQTVEFNGQEDQHSVELYSTEVTVIPSPGGHNHGSSKVKLKNIVDFMWEHNFYPGQLLAVHMSGKYLAYGIKVSNGGNMVRVVCQEYEQRALLRGMRAAIQDLAFAHVSTAILACVDLCGNLFIHTIESTISELSCSLLLQVDAADPVNTDHRVIWCPYIPEDAPSDGDEVSKLLILTRGSKAELWSVNTVTSRFRSIEATDPVAKENGGMLEIDQHSDTIVEATFSPDGTALATASYDGEVKFFQVYLHGNSHGNQAQPRCLHQWRPHGGRPISCLFFLDDHKTYQPDVQFWRFAITGCDNNTELRVWSCELWTCLQTIKFAPTPSTGILPILKAGLDLSAGYLLLSDIYNKVLYILSITKDTGKILASVTTISEFLLPYPILSFGIVDAGMRKIRPTGESLEDLCPVDEEVEEQLVIQMYLVQPKSLQECHIAFRPASQASGRSLMDTLAQDTLDYSEELSNIGTVNHNGISGENCEEDLSLSTTIDAATNHNTGLNLMTPDAFSSPAKKENNELDSRPCSPELDKVLSPSPSLAQAVQALNATDPPLVKNELEEQAPASSGSSPSREVREILSLTKPDEEPEAEKEPESTNYEDTNYDWPMPMELFQLREPEGYTSEDEKKVKDESKSTTHTTGDAESTWQVANELNTLELINKLESILEIIQDQRQEVRELRTEVTRLGQETPISTRVESALAKASQQQNATLEQTLYGQMSRQHEFFNTLETTIKDKIETTLPRIIEDTVEPLKHQLRLDSARMDELLKENLTELINSSHVKDTLALAAANAAKPALDMAFKETFTNIILPGMEKACQTMFRQVQDAFDRGTREYLENVDVIADKQYQQRNEQQSETLSALIREELQTELNRCLNALQEETTRTIRDCIRDNLNQQLTELTNARSRATTPAITVPAVADAQARVISLLQRGQLNAAFQQALSASDLGLVVLVCEKTEPARVFSCSVGPQGQSSRCILPQPVILSLVQQLSADLGHRTELKHRWLEEAILNLDPNDPVTREHMGTVLITLQNQLSAFVTANPNHSSTRRMKMLAMAARALLNQHP
ncbi:enhancer of mRNA-decapping protein 4 [Hylaeus volcanicus]|uniref:enhancer of mRNA-decapping protein 4 n=1 Tax=Hylaeus volcanicus TaxID=313075 RepID=UPI0023B8118E|nr:enhancer of mRNA-decapping protein 4 [Hylaeus volcanicus]